MKNNFKPVRLLSYVVASDDGLAPNVDGGVCSLSVCKPVVRRVSRVGEDYIVGMSTAKDGRNKVIYAMQVDEKIAFQDYFRDSRFQCKKPTAKRNGDNFFEDVNGRLQIAFSSAAHMGRPQAIRRDLMYPYSVIGERFWYFGMNAPELPVDLRSGDISLPDRSRRGHRVTDDPFLLEGFVEWLGSWSCGVHGNPRDIQKISL